MMRKHQPRATVARPDHAGRLLTAIALAAAFVLLAAQAFGQQTPPPQPTPDNGVVAAPSVDPQMKVKPPVGPSSLPTPVIPPPGTPGGNPDTVPK